MTKEYFLRLSNYNIWANQKICDWCLQIEEQDWLKNLGGSMPTISETCIHIAGAETLWCQRLLLQEQNFQSENYKGPGKREELINIWKTASENLKNYLLSISEADLIESFPYKNIKGESFSSLRHEALAHVFNHSSYHRGQIVNYLRQIGFTNVSSTDLIGYYRL